MITAVREALYYQAHDKGVKCLLCPKACVIAEGKTGFCQVRENREGTLYTQNYAHCSSYALDPIEKKPLYHFYPGSNIFSIGTWGCNFACSFCQNWQIAQQQPQTVDMPPETAVKIALEAGHNNIGIAYTYSEPSVWYEYVLDTAKLARQAGLKNVLVTNGFINHAPLFELLPYIDAMNIDVKAFNNGYYQKVCLGTLEHVKRTVEQAAAGCHVEVTTLLVPGLNDSEDEITELAKWLGSVNANIPLHFSRYFPNYKLDRPPTPLATMHKAYEAAKQYVNYVYLGNMQGEGVNTYCHVCRQLVIDRLHQHSTLTSNKKCPQCGSCISVVGEVYF